MKMIDCLCHSLSIHHLSGNCTSIPLWAIVPPPVLAPMILERLSRWLKSEVGQIQSEYFPKWLVQKRASNLIRHGEKEGDYFWNLY